MKKLSRERGKYKVGIRKGLKESRTIVIEDEHIINVKIDFPYIMSSSKIKFLLLDSLVRFEWLLPTDSSKATESTIKIERLQLFSNLSDAVKW